MRHVVSQVEKERPVLVLLDELDGPLRIPGRQLCLIRVQGNDFIALYEWQIREFGAGILGPHVVGVWQAEIIIKTMVRRQEAWVMAEVPLSVNGRRIAAGLKHLG